MGFIGNMLGINGNTGMNWKAASADLQDPLKNSQVNGSQSQLTTAQQQSLASQLASQTQSQGALDQQQALVGATGAQGGLSNQSSVFNQQQALANQLGTMAQGGGPNPAQAMLAQQTGQNVANQAALMAGQRGSGANAGLLARQAAQQGANTQQQSAGQAATMQSQQQLNAINALQGQQNSMANLATTQAGQQIGATNTAANLAQQQQGMVQQYGLGQENLALQNQGQIIAAAQAFNAQKLSDVQQQNASNAAVQNTTAGGQSKMGNGIISGMMNGASSMAGSMGSMAEGGEVTLPDQPGIVSTPTPADADDGSEWKPSSGGGGGGGGGGGSGAALMALAAMANGGQVGSNQVGSNAILKENYKGPKSKLGMHLASYAKGGHVKHVDAMVSPGEIILSKDKAEAVKQGKASPLSGKKVPGQAPVGGAKNSYANDVVPAKLEAGGIVLPRSVTQSANPGAAAKKFIDALKSKKGK